VEFPLAREAVFAVQIAGVRDVQAERFDLRVARLEIRRFRLVNVRREQFSRLLERVDVIKVFVDLRRRDGLP